MCEREPLLSCLRERHPPVRTAFPPMERERPYNTRLRAWHMWRAKDRSPLRPSVLSYLPLLRNARALLWCSLIFYFILALEFFSPLQCLQKLKLEK